MQNYSFANSDSFVFQTVNLPNNLGCSSQMALLKENGPCNINEYGNGTDLNEFSWTNKANVIWVG